MALAVVRLASLAEAAPHWQQLLLADANATFFATPAWLTTWWAHHAAGRHLLLFLVRADGGQPAGLALLQRERLSRMGGEQIGFLGAGLSDYGDFLCDEQVAPRRDVLEALLEHLVALFPRALFDFQQIPETSPTRTCLEAWVRARRFASTTLMQDVCPITRLPEQVEVLHQQFKKSFLLDLRRGDRRLRERGQVALVDQIRPADGDWRPLKQQMAELQSQRMRTKGEVPLWQGPLGAFVQDVLQAADAQGSLRVTGLYLDEELIAYELCFLHGRTIYAWSRAFDEAYKNCGPGKIALLRLLETGIAQGYQTFDLLRGEEPYKELWTNGRTQNVRVVFVAHPSLPVRLRYRYITDWKARLQQSAAIKRLYRIVKGLRRGAG